jgi:hypothetical protein
MQVIDSFRGPSGFVLISNWASFHPLGDRALEEYNALLLKLDNLQKENLLLKENNQTLSGLTPRASDVCPECGKDYSHYTGCSLAIELPRTTRRR